MKKPRKLNAKQRELQASWNDIVDRWASVPKFARTSTPRVALGRTTKATNEPERTARPYPSLVLHGPDLGHRQVRCLERRAGQGRSQEGRFRFPA